MSLIDPFAPRFGRLKMRDVWDPFSSLDVSPFEDWMDWMTMPTFGRGMLSPFTTGWPTLTGWPTMGEFPLTDFRETSDKYIVDTELPGVKKEDIKVGVNRGFLTISGETSKVKEEEDEFSHRRERRYGSYRRRIRIPDDVDESKIEAQYKDGILQVNMPKKEEAKGERRSITIK